LLARITDYLHFTPDLVLRSVPFGISHSGLLRLLDSVQQAETNLAVAPSRTDWNAQSSIEHTWLTANPPFVWSDPDAPDPSDGASIVNAPNVALRCDEQ
jgi:hypothetical protein